VIDANGVVDEAQALIGVARAEAAPGGELDALLIEVERDLWVLMAEVATAPGHRHKLVAGTSLVTAEMVAALEARIDEMNDRFDMPSDFVVPGQNRVSALLDVARTVVRRGERLVVTALADVDSEVGAYLNRLSDLLWTTARWQEGEHLLSRAAATQRGNSKNNGTKKRTGTKSTGTKSTGTKSTGTKSTGAKSTGAKSTRTKKGKEN
jgi:cob(I)alamin adenosyltransferase